MPSKTTKQARTMAGAAHDPKFAKKMGIPPAVAKEFNRADAKTGILRKKKRLTGAGGVAASSDGGIGGR
jgi:hypothetical protein